MILIDRLFLGGLRFVFDQIANAAEAEEDDAASLRERLLAAQMQLELGEITEERFCEIELSVAAGLRELRRRESESREAGHEDLRVTGAEVTIEVDFEEPEARGGGPA